MNIEHRLKIIDQEIIVNEPPEKSKLIENEFLREVIMRPISIVKMTNSKTSDRRKTLYNLNRKCEL